jgi:serine/threonine protein kinase
LKPSSRFGVGWDSGLQVLWEDGERVFCRGESHADGNDTAVLAVFPAAEHPTPATLDRLAHEYGLRDDLDDGWAARPLELVRERGQTKLVLKDPGGEPLDRLIGSPMEVGRFLRLAVALSAALGRLHERGLIHKDIKPANVLVSSATDQVWLTGFGIASRLPRERQAPDPPEFIAGTLAYMAPEQTGRMNRAIDSRSDLYALGVTLYQMLRLFAVYGCRSHGVGPLPCRQKTGGTQRSAGERPGPSLADHHEAARQGGRGALPNCRRR